MPLRGQVVFSVKHLFCGNVKTITCIVDEVLVEEVVQSVSAFDDFEDRDESDLESDETFKKTFSTEKVLLKDFPQFLSIPDTNAIPEICPRNGEDFIKIVGFSTA